MKLSDLSTLAKSVQKAYLTEYYPGDCILPTNFKKSLSKFNNNDTIEYFDYSLVVTGTSSLKIYIPNQWVYIASYFVEYYQMIKVYRDKVFSLFNDNKEAIKSCKDNQAKAESLLTHYNGDDKEYLIKFLSDYSWWEGGKTLDRTDYYVSPILSLAGLINVSQSYVSDICRNLAENPEAYEMLKTFRESLNYVSKTNQKYSFSFEGESIDSKKYLRAMRTKPFLLLAGISGTGKSRIVKQMAFESCPATVKTEEWNLSSLRNDETTPGNYCLVEVKPNWHDSSELLGYESQIGTPHYVVTTFVRFLAKAMLYEEKRVPFFVCLDEMNLAPVEQYFAEFLSVLESRKVVDGKITSETLIPAQIFANAKYKRLLKEDLFGLQVKQISDENGHKVKVFDGELADAELAVYNKLQEQGLRIPSNLIVIGTVNMDETTHQFSRKVIDRAMTIEMNLPEDKPFMDFFNNSSNLEYKESPLSADFFLPTVVKAADAIEVLTADSVEKTNDLKVKIATVLADLNAALEDTPFKIAYRVQNELVLYFYELWQEDKTKDWDEILNTSVDQILMMKVLPRVEGDEELLENPLAKLVTFCDNGNYSNAAKKVYEMQKRLKHLHFTSYWP